MWPVAYTGENGRADRKLREGGSGKNAKEGLTESPKPPTSIFRRHSKCRAPFLFFLLLPLQLNTLRIQAPPLISRSLYLYSQEGNNREFESDLILQYVNMII